MNYGIRCLYYLKCKYGDQNFYSLKEIEEVNKIKNVNSFEYLNDAMKTTIVKKYFQEAVNAYMMKKLNE